MLKVLLITENFPFLPGEQFLEDEVKYWADAADIDLTIAPLNARGEPRLMPDTVKVDTSLAQFNRTPQHYLRGLISPLFWRECLGLLRRRRVSFAALVEAAKACVRVQQVFSALMNQDGRYDIIYCYWNDVGAYAAALAKRNGKCTALVSRVHGFDLYEERRKGNNLPLKRQFLSDFDRVHVISRQALRYFSATYGPAALTISPLGVPVTDGCSKPSPEGVLRILSVSFCIAVKRLDRILDGIAEFAMFHSNLTVEWTHIGDGPLLQEIRERAAQHMGRITNLRISLVGYLPNRQVRQCMLEESWDLFINASESEGVPVSIMEAMSFGIPVVATDVGGVSELVERGLGVLIPSDADAACVASAIGSFFEVAKSTQTRSACKQKIDVDFNASRNYRRFVESVSGLINS